MVLHLLNSRARKGAYHAVRQFMQRQLQIMPAGQIILVLCFFNELACGHALVFDHELADAMNCGKAA